MPNPYVFPSFNFYPKRLNEESQRIYQKYKDADIATPKQIMRKLPDLLDKIRKLKNDQEIIINFANKLKPIDINILSSEYPYESEDEVTVKKIILILNVKYTRVVGKRFWSHFQHIPDDQEVQNMLGYCFNNESDDFLALKQKVRQVYTNIFNHEKVILNIAIAVGAIKQPLLETFADWRIDQESRLAEKLWSYILFRYMRESWFITTQGADLIEEKLEYMPLSFYKQVMEQYLSANNFDDYNDQIMKQLISRLRDPREDKTQWHDMKETTISSVISWLHKHELFEFLDYDRFDYWKKYLRYISKLEVIESPPVAAMYFDEFVVLEFGEIGNAVYFYETAGFDKHIAPKLISKVYESTLKDPDAHFFIRKLSHTKGTWHSRFDRYMTNYLNGNFNIR